MTDMTCSRRSFAKGVACASACAVAGGLGLSGCGGDSAGEAGSSDAKAASYKIGVLQLTEHPALDAANKGFVEAIEAADINAKINQQNAQNDQSACQTIASTLVNENCDLILAIATPAAQAVAGATSDKMCIRDSPHAGERGSCLRGDGVSQIRLWGRRTRRS